MHSFDRLDKKIYIFILERRKIENPEQRKKGKNEMKNEVKKRKKTWNEKLRKRRTITKCKYRYNDTLAPDKRYIMRVIISATVLFDPKGPVFSTGHFNFAF